VLDAAPGGAPLYIVLNAAPDDIEFKTPPWPGCRAWKLLLDTTKTNGAPADEMLDAGQVSKAPPRSILVWEGVK
jgi:isoamylase